MSDVKPIVRNKVQLLAEIANRTDSPFELIRDEDKRIVIFAIHDGKIKVLSMCGYYSGITDEDIDHMVNFIDSGAEPYDDYDDDEEDTEDEE